MSCEAHMCKVVELSLCANFLNTDPYTRVLKRWLVYAGCDCLTMFICFCACASVHAQVSVCTCLSEMRGSIDGDIITTEIFPKTLLAHIEHDFDSNARKEIFNALIQVEHNHKL